MVITSRDPWQNLLASRTTVPSSKVVQAADVIKGFAGSWAGAWSLSPAITSYRGGTPGQVATDATLPGQSRVKFTHLGQPGFPEINFAPYTYRTNRMGAQGGALLGHPISFSFVGPTAKNSNTLWDWTSTTINTPGIQDQLVLRCTGVPYTNNAGIPVGGPTSSGTVGGTSGAYTFTVSPNPGWSTNVYANWGLIDKNGSIWQISANTGNVLTINSSSPPAAGSWVLSPPIPTLYGFSALTDFPGGLYLAVTQTGNPGQLAGYTGSVTVADVAGHINSDTYLSEWITATTTGSSPNTQLVLSSNTVVLSVTGTVTTGDTVKAYGVTKTAGTDFASSSTANTQSNEAYGVANSLASAINATAGLGGVTATSSTSVVLLTSSSNAITVAKSSADITDSGSWVGSGPYTRTLQVGTGGVVSPGDTVTINGVVLTAGATVGSGAFLSSASAGTAPALYVVAATLAATLGAGAAVVSGTTVTVEGLSAPVTVSSAGITFAATTPAIKVDTTSTAVDSVAAHGKLTFSLGQTSTNGAMTTTGQLDPTTAIGGLALVLDYASNGSSYTQTFTHTFTGGSGDGGLTLADITSYPPIQPIGAGKYQIFRVTGLATTNYPNDTLVLDKGKRLSSYFTAPTGTSGNSIRSVMMFRPAATRLVAVPQPGASVGHEQVFAVVPPERALITDDQYPYTTWSPIGSNPQWYENYPSDWPLGRGTFFDYNYGPQLPVPLPKGVINCFAQAGGGAPVVTTADTFTLVNISYEQPNAGQSLQEPTTVAGFQVTSLIGKIIHLYQVQQKDGVTLKVGGTSGFTAPLSHLIGWFEVVGASSSGTGSINLRRVMQADPETGRTFLGSSAWFYTSTSDAQGIQLWGTVHDPISSLWETPPTGSPWTPSYASANLNAIESARLTNIIDPTWVERSLKDQPFPVMGSPSRPDKAVFDTSSTTTVANIVGGTNTAGTNADPGSMLDLGFRMVLYPATTASVMQSDGTSATRCIPDWSHPIHSNEVVLDPGQPSVKQYVTVDYSNGLVTLSVPPQPDSGAGGSWSSKSPLYPPSVVLTAPDNPRGEVVLFACCVPYSMEEGQLGGGVRITGDNTGQTSGQTDLWSDRIILPVAVPTGTHSNAIFIDFSNNIGETVTVGGVTFTAVSGSPTLGSQFLDATHNSQEAAINSLAASINAAAISGVTAIAWGQPSNTAGGVYLKSATPVAVVPGVGTHIGTGSMIVSDYLPGNRIDLNGNLISEIPDSGYVELVYADSTAQPIQANSAPIFSSQNRTAGTWRGALFGYNGVSYDSASGFTSLLNVYGGGTHGQAFWLTTYTPSGHGGQPWPIAASAVFRRDVWGPSGIDGVAGVDIQNDVTYGFAKRTQTLRFQGAPLRVGKDGSTTVVLDQVNYGAVSYTGANLNLTTTTLLSQSVTVNGIGRPIWFTLAPANAYPSSSYVQLSGAGTGTPAQVSATITISVNYGQGPADLSSTQIQAAAGVSTSWPLGSVSTLYVPPSAGSFTFAVTVTPGPGTTVTLANYQLVAYEL